MLDFGGLQYPATSFEDRGREDTKRLCGVGKRAWWMDCSENQGVETRYPGKIPTVCLGIPWGLDFCTIMTIMYD